VCLAWAGRYSIARILIVEDDAGVREFLRETLELEGHEVVEAENGREALELYRDRAADLIITDLVMPELDGIGMILALRKEFPQVRIVAVSGAGPSAPGDYLPAARALGALRTWVKPVDAATVIGEIRELVGPNAKRRE